jgi:hypothetical protein
VQPTPKSCIKYEVRKAILISRYTARGWSARAVLCLLVALASCDHHAGSDKVGEMPHNQAGKETAVESWAVVCFEYLGPSDRPPLPVIFARDANNLQAFLTVHQDSQRYQHGRHLLVKDDVIECLARIAGQHSATQLSPNQSAIRITLWKPAAEEHFDLAASEGIKLLEAADGCLIPTEAAAAIKTVRQWLAPTAISP